MREKERGRNNTLVDKKLSEWEILLMEIYMNFILKMVINQHTFAYKFNYFFIQRAAFYLHSARLFHLAPQLSN